MLEPPNIHAKQEGVKREIKDNLRIWYLFAK